MNNSTSRPGTQRRNSIELNDVVINGAGHVNPGHEPGEDASLEHPSYQDSASEPFVIRRTQRNLTGAKKDLFQHVSLSYHSLA